jgi:murein DD-endopeptidase MepM/ murein hydrolase activator NlpD
MVTQRGAEPMNKIIVIFYLFCCALLFNTHASEFSPSMQPLFRVVDLNIGERSTVHLHDGKRVTVELLNITEHRCEIRNALRKALVTCKIDGKEIELVCATYNLPLAVDPIQIDCPVVRGYVSDSSKKNVWALEKDARLRLWPAGSHWIRPGTFCYPVKQKWFASDTQMSNAPCYVNACDIPGQKTVYYHYGLDFGGAEGLVDVVAATSGRVISKGTDIMPGDHPEQVNPRYDVVYIRDDRGWYYRYSHLKTLETAIQVGDRIDMGDRIGSIGKEGGSGGWTHLHFDVTMPQPSGRYGITDGYAFIFQAYTDTFKPDMIAVARPHIVTWAGQTIVLDASKSWHSQGKEKIKRYTWTLSNGTTQSGQTVECSYGTPGHYTEILKVVDEQNRESYDFAVVQVFDPKTPLPVPPAIHVAYWPTTGIKAGDKVTFKVRTFGINPDEGQEVWDFGDGSLAGKTRSDGNISQHAKDGYATIHHRFDKPGKYIVTANRTNERGMTATGRVLVEVGKR